MTQPSPKHIRPSQHRKLLAEEDRASSLRPFDSVRPPKEKENLTLTSLITQIMARTQRNRTGAATNAPADQDPPPLDAQTPAALPPLPPTLPPPDAPATAPPPQPVQPIQPPLAPPLNTTAPVLNVNQPTAVAALPDGILQALEASFMAKVTPTFNSINTQLENLTNTNVALAALCKTAAENSMAQPPAEDTWRKYQAVYRETYDKTTAVPLSDSSTRPALQAASFQELQLRTADTFIEKSCETAQGMPHANAVAFLVDHLTFARSKIKSAADQSNFQAQVIVKADTVGHDFVDYAHSNLALQHGGDYEKATSSITEASKAYVQDRDFHRDRDYNRDHHKPNDGRHDDYNHAPKKHDNKRTQRKDNNTRAYNARRRSRSRSR